MSDLKPCPWCGPAAQVETFFAEHRGGYWYASCLCCDCEGPPHDSAEASLEAWNRRPSPTAQGPEEGAKCGKCRDGWALEPGGEPGTVPCPCTPSAKACPEPDCIDGELPQAGGKVDCDVCEGGTKFSAKAGAVSAALLKRAEFLFGHCGPNNTLESVTEFQRCGYELLLALRSTPAPDVQENKS